MKKLLITILLSACATPGARPHDMSAAQHEQHARQEVSAADHDAAKYDPGALAIAPGCGPYDAVCWRAKQNPTARFRDMAEQHRRAAADHRAASAALREIEATACAGIAAEDRDISPFERTEDIASTAPLSERRATGNGRAQTITVGARVVFYPVPGLTPEKLQRELDCHLARAAVLGHELPEMPDCPLVPKGVHARVVTTDRGLAVEVRGEDSTAAADIVARAERLKIR